VAIAPPCPRSVLPLMPFVVYLVRRRRANVCPITITVTLHHVSASWNFSSAKRAHVLSPPTDLRVRPDTKPTRRPRACRDPPSPRDTATFNPGRSSTHPPRCAPIFTAKACPASAESRPTPSQVNPPRPRHESQSSSAFGFGTLSVSNQWPPPDGSGWARWRRRRWRRLGEVAVGR